MRDALLLAGFVGFLSGILCRSFITVPWQVLAVVMVVATALFLISLRVPHTTLYRVIAVLLIALAFGSVRVGLAEDTLPDTFVQDLDTKITLEGTVVAEPDIRETSQRITVLLEKGSEEAKVIVVAQLYPEVVYGERVRVTGTLALPEPFETDTGRVFNYDRFLAKDKVFALVNFAHVEHVSEPEGLWVRGMGSLFAFKHAFQNGLASAIPEPGASLAVGLITGGKQGLGETLLDVFIITGLVHIVVLSGYNVMIVAEGVLRAFGFLPKRTAAIIAGITIGLFVLVAGAGPASVRAGFMAGLALLARATGRTYVVVRALLIVAFIMLLMNPLLLVHDPGFQLSFVATLGLILLSPLIESWLSFVPGAFLRSLTASTLAAQIAVLPLLLYQTGLFSVVSLPANVLVLPVLPLAMATSFVAGLAGMIAPAVATFIGLPAHFLLVYVIEMARWFAALPLASLSIPQFPFVLVVVAYSALGILIAKAPVRREATQVLS